MEKRWDIFTTGGMCETNIGIVGHEVMLRGSEHNINYLFGIGENSVRSA